MASNLSSIGFTFADAKEFQHVMLDLAPRCIERIGCNVGDYAVWRSRTGAEIWFHLATFGTEDDARDIIGLTPFYEGFSEIAVDVTERLNRPDDNPFEGAFKAWVVDESDGQQLYPVTFDAVDFAAHAGVTLPSRASARITGFARELHVYRDENEFAARPEDAERLPLGPRAFVPIGQFAGLDDAAAPSGPDSSALLTGSVREHSLHTNEVSGETFHWLLVDSLGAAYDIVADTATVNGTIEIGCTVEVTCILIGRLMAD